MLECNCSILWQITGHNVSVEVLKTSPQREGQRFMSVDIPSYVDMNLANVLLVALCSATELCALKFVPAMYLQWRAKNARARVTDFKMSCNGSNYTEQILRVLACLACGH